MNPDGSRKEICTNGKWQKNIKVNFGQAHQHFKMHYCRIKKTSYDNDPQ